MHPGELDRLNAAELASLREAPRAQRVGGRDLILSGKHDLAVTVLQTDLDNHHRSSFNLLLPVFFPEAASYPFLDAATTIMSVVAMWLMARKKIESWIYWIIADVTGIWLYFVKAVKFISLLIVILFVMAVNGLRSWHKIPTRSAIKS